MRFYRMLRATSLVLAGLLLLLTMSVPAVARHAAIGAEITTKEFEFTGGTTLPAGTNVLFRNADEAPHTLSGTNGKFDSGPVSQDGEMIVSTEHLRPGSYEFFCRVHPDMVGTLTVE